MEDVKRMVLACLAVNFTFWFTALLSELIGGKNPMVTGGLAVATWMLYKVEQK